MYTVDKTEWSPDGFHIKEDKGGTGHYYSIQSLVDNLHHRIKEPNKFKVVSKSFNQPCKNIDNIRHFVKAALMKGEWPIRIELNDSSN